MHNSNYDLYRTIIKYSLHYGNTTLGENVRYFMHKYNIVFTDWFEYINTLYKKIDIYMSKITLMQNVIMYELRLENCVKHVTVAAHNLGT